MDIGWFASGQPRDWANIASAIAASAIGTEIDEAIDAICEDAIATRDPEATEALTMALERAKSAFTIRSAALALAVCASSQTPKAPDALVAAYRRFDRDGFLGPALLDALGLCAYVNVIARHELASLLLRLTRDDDRYLLIKACQAIGRLDALQSATGLVTKLEEFATSDDLQVQAEASKQLGVLRLSEAMSAKDHGSLFESLTHARVAFEGAEATDELRLDAQILKQLIDMILGVRALALAGDDQQSNMVERLSAVKSTLGGVTNRHWIGYWSPYEGIAYTRALEMADSLFQAGQAISVSGDWTNLDKALVDLAALLTLSRSNYTELMPISRVDSAIIAVPSVIIPTLGPAILRSVGRRRLSRVREQYVLLHGDDDIAQTLIEIERAATNSDYSFDEAHLESDALVRLATQMNESPGTFIQRLMDALERHPGDNWLHDLGLGSMPLPIDRPTYYGGDHIVDEVVRALLAALRGQLGTRYPPIKWQRLIAVLESIIQLAHYLRDVPPKFMLSDESGGLGQGASESDLQERVFEALRQQFGQSAIYEHQRIGGGRPDTGVMFPECQFPIEVKHEFTSIEREHIRKSYLAQADLYAACTDGVALLLILDLRASNSGAHLARRRRTKSASQEQLLSFSSLSDNFWIDWLPPDPEIVDATPAVVVVGVFPGNRLRPSEATQYSQRPRQR